MSLKPNKIGEIFLKLASVPLGLYLILLGSGEGLGIMAWAYFIPAFGLIMWGILDFLPTYEEK